MDQNMEHRVDLPDPDPELNLNPIDRSKLFVLQILEWFQIHELEQSGESEKTRLLDRLLDLLRNFNPENDLKNNIWIKRVTDSQDFRLLISSIKKEPGYSAYFNDVINKKGCRSDNGDGYGGSTSSKDDEDEVQVVADSLFLEEENVAYRVLGIKSDFKCLDCHKTNCTSVVPKIRSSTSPETLSKLFALLFEAGKGDLDYVLVLGSGIGGVTFSTRLFLPNARIYSCEADFNLFTLQNSVVHKHGMSPNVTVLNFLNFGVAKCMDLVILCERLFTTINLKQRKQILLSLRQNMKPATRLVVYRRAEDWLQEGEQEVEGVQDAKLFGIYNQKLNVDELPLAYFEEWLLLEYEVFMDDEAEVVYYHVYRVDIDESGQSG